MGQMNDYFWAINKNLKRKINEKNKLAKDIEDFIYFSREWVNYYNKINDQDKKAQYEDMFELCKQIGTMNRACDDCFSDLFLKDRLLPGLQIYTYMYDNNGFNKKKQKKCEKVIDQWMDMVSQIEKEIDYISESCIQAMQPIESKKIETRNQELYKARENEYKASRERIINLYNRLEKDFFMQYKASKIVIDPNIIYEVADLISYMDILEKNNELHKKHKELSIPASVSLLSGARKPLFR